MKEIKDKNSINLELDEIISQGIYSNLALINHSVSEFVIDFVNIMPGVPKAKVKSRVIMTPQNTKRLIHALNENIKKFEQIHGPVKMDSSPNTQGFPINFGGPKAEA